VLEVLLHRGSGDLELEADFIVLLAEFDPVENLPLARRELLDPGVALIEHEHVQAAGLRESNVESTVSMREHQPATAEDTWGHASLFDL
jgi:hypothetical protein